MGYIGWPELLIVLAIVLLIFGPKLLPGIGKQLGTGMREFKDSITGKDREERDERRAREIAAANVTAAAEAPEPERQPAEPRG